MLNAAFHRLAWSNLAAQSAEQLSLAAVPLVAVLAFGAGVTETGLLAAAQSLPFLLLALPMGVLADRMPRRRLMAAAEIARAAALASLPVLAWLGWLSLPMLAAIGFLSATGTVAFSVAAPSLVPSLVPRAAMAAANGRLELARSAAFAAGPAVAGALVTWSGASAAFALAAALSVGAAILLRGIDEPARPSSPRRQVAHDLREGANFVWRQRLLRPLLLTAVAWNISWFILQAAYVPYAVSVLGLSARTIGLTLAAYGIGMVAGALAAPRIARAMRFGRNVVVGPFVSVLAAMAMVATLAWPAAPLAGLSFFLFGAGPIIWTIAQTTLRQAVTPGDMLGRVSAIITMASSGARPIGAAIAALVGTYAGSGACLALAACGFLVQAIVIILSPVPALARLPEPALV